MTGRIPLAIGVTGHINLREADREALYRVVIRELEDIRKACPHTPLKMINSLAAGADLLCAEAAEEIGIPLVAALPMEEAEYRKDFDAEALIRFEHQLDRAEAAVVVPAEEPVPAEETRSFRYRQAGIYVAEHSHLVLALWDGKDSAGRGAGTAVTVQCALEGAWNPEKGLPVRSGDNSGVIHIMAPREDDPSGSAGQVRRLGNAKALKTILEKTEEFNSLAETDLPDGEALLPPEEVENPEMRELESLYHTADGLSTRYARQYRRLLAGLALAGTMLTMAFLMYDNADMQPMILACGAALCAALLLTRFAGRTACHRRFIEYRALAEAFRVQLFLRYAGSGLQAQRLMTWRQKQENAWILCALCAVNAAPLPDRKRDILDCWVKGQRDYYRHAGKKAGIRQKKQDRMLGCAAAVSIVIYIFLVVYELCCGGLFFAPAFSAGDPEKVRTLMKVVLGTVSAGTLFLAGFYGKMSLNRIQGDYEKMEAFYEKAADRIARCGENEQILEILAREELTENGNWSSYQQDNALEMSL